MPEDLYWVGKTVKAEGRELETGEVVDASDWRWREQLVEINKLFPVDHPERVVTCMCGTKLRDEDYLGRHQKYHCEFDLDMMTREDLTEFIEDHDEIDLEEIEGSGVDGYVKVSDLQDAIRDYMGVE